MQTTQEQKQQNHLEVPMQQRSKDQVPNDLGSNLNAQRILYGVNTISENFDEDKQSSISFQQKVIDSYDQDASDQCSIISLENLSIQKMKQKAQSEKLMCSDESNNYDSSGSVRMSKYDSSLSRQYASNRSLAQFPSYFSKTQTQHSEKIATKQYYFSELDIESQNCSQNNFTLDNLTAIQYYKCQNCMKVSEPVIDYVISYKTIIWFLILLLIGFGICLCLIPLFLYKEYFKEPAYFCPHCKQLIKQINK